LLNSRARYTDSLDVIKDNLLETIVLELIAAYVDLLI